MFFFLLEPMMNDLLCTVYIPIKMPTYDSTISADYVLLYWQYNLCYLSSADSSGNTVAVKILFVVAGISHRIFSDINNHASF